MGIAKILIVDDRVENLLTLESLLDEPDIELVRATSGIEALGLTLDHDFALVLLDVQMPGMDGYEVAELMRGNKKTKHIPIIFITAAFRADVQVFKGYECGAVDYLFKPLDERVFKSKVGVFIELFRHKDALSKKTRELDRKLVELEELQQQLEETNERLHLLSTTDGLTGLLNKRQFDTTFEEEWQRGIRTKSPLSLLLLDIDHFKAYNDTYGHAAGDDCLKKVAMAISDAAKRNADKVARIGGEEFAVLLPETDPEGAQHVAERLLKAVSSLDISHRGSLAAEHVTTSIGLSTIVPGQGYVQRDLLETADAGLYRAKENGRNSTWYHAPGPLKN
ncbi:diguanylate cyclase response regulator [Desulfoluna limicola]|uniref:diguanylate cyclase n=1 Tax=Desulfoluna limicola TaxID=2810562 RepID=A0ABN6F2S1_9BACT|nr:diguanylate cyclase [Desulfoluna limicola]BCS96344.1 diguanylate cyclase response regulator [Desulfoluna limicola]